MNPNDKKWLIGGGVAVAAFVGYKLLSDGTESAAGSADEDPTGNGTGNANTVFNANAVAIKLYDAMKEMGTQELEIIKALTTVSQTQFALVAQAFGWRSYNKQLGNQINFSPFFPLPTVNLKGWLKSELSAKNYSTLADKYPNHL